MRAQTLGTRFAGRPLHFSGVFPVAEGLAFVDGGLATGQGKLDLCLSVAEIDTEWDQGETLLGDRPGDAVDLPTMEQELALPLRVVPALAGKVIWADVGSDQKRLAMTNLGVGVLEFHLPLPQRLHLRAKKNHPCLEAVDHRIVATGPPI